MSAAKKLPQREELFVASFIASGNSAEAARQAGYSQKTAKEKGCELLKRPRVAAAIAAAKKRIVTKFKVTGERVVEEMAVVGFSDIRNYRLNDDGYVVLTEGAPDSAMRAVKKIKRKMRLIPTGRGDDATLVREIETEFELWNKDVELRNLGDYLKLFKENRSDDDQDDDLTTEQLNERVIALLRVASKRQREAGGRKRAG
jgi:phage terminase small subunit